MTAIRRARRADHGRILEVMDDWWGGRRMSALLPSLFLEHFASSSFVAESDTGELVGFLVGFLSQDSPDEAYVHVVGVEPSTRGQRLGQQLHDAFAREVAGRGARRIRCVTSTTNTDSVAFHTSIGFAVDGFDEPVRADGVDDVAGHVRLVRERSVPSDPAPPG